MKCSTKTNSTKIGRR